MNVRFSYWLNAKNREKGGGFFIKQTEIGGG
jgi:hypothetical protein